MNKDLLQAELLQKIKPGVKASDLKKKSEREASFTHGLPTPPDSPILKPKLENISPSPMVQKNEKQARHNPDKEKVKVLLAENKHLKEKLAQLEKQVKPTTEPQPREIKTFRCSDCQQEKSQGELSRAFNNFSFCLECSKKARQQAQQEKSRPEPQDFTCHTCQQTKSEIPAKMKLDQTLQAYLICSPCRPTLKEFNEADLITDELWAKYPYSSASEILEKEFNIKKEETW